MKKILSAVLLATAVATPALAADKGAYVNIETGQVSYGDFTSQFSTTKFANPGSLTFGGGFHFNQNLGVEGGYSIIGDSIITTIPSNVPSATITEKLKTSSLQVAAVGTYSINERFDVFGKLGLASTKIDYTASVTNATFTAGTITYSTVSKTNLMFGIGGQFNINKHFGIRAQYQDLGTIRSPGTTKDIKTTIISVGGVYNF